MDDDVVTVPIEEGEKKMDDKDFLSFYTKSMLDGRDERQMHQRRFQSILEMEYAEGKDFRGAQAMQVLKESGAGQSRVITTLPGPHAGAPGTAGGVG